MTPGTTRNNPTTGEPEILVDKGVKVWTPKPGNGWLVNMFDGLTDGKGNHISIGYDYQNRPYVSDRTMKWEPFLNIDDDLLGHSIYDLCELIDLWMWEPDL